MNSKAFELFTLLNRQGFSVSYANHGNGDETVTLMHQGNRIPFDSDPVFRYRFDRAQEFHSHERITHQTFDKVKGEIREKTV